MPFINEAVYALAGGVAGAEAIDTVARLGFGHPLGPLALADLIGLDTCVAIMEVLERRASASRATRPARSCASTSRPGGSAASPGAASSPTVSGAVEAFSAARSTREFSAAGRSAPGRPRSR